MKNLCLLIAIVLSSTPLLATTCIANREFKVRQVCGRVTDKAGGTIPDVRIELMDANSYVIQSVQTDEKGEFVFPSVSDGKYILKIKFNGFATAWQPFRVSRSKPAGSCGVPIRVTLEVAGYCSSIEGKK